MGAGDWSASVYDATTRARVRSGTTFGYSATLSSAPRSSWKAHESLDPKGVGMRESRDTAEHPTSRAITVLFDVTGSMLTIPVDLQKKLPELLGLLLRKGYIEHPHIMFGAIGDATCDAVPLQIGQWESDNRMDEDLDRIVLEGGGGGQVTESYELALYFMARHTVIDCFEKRGDKGLLFIIGDEKAYPSVDRAQVSKVIGDTLQANIPTTEIVSEVSERFHTYFLLPKGASHGGSAAVLNSWKALLGQNVIELDSPSNVCEAIAVLVGLHEGIDLDSATRDLSDSGVAASSVHSVSTSLARVAADLASTGRGAVVQAESGSLSDLATTSGTGRRL